MFLDLSIRNVDISFSRGISNLLFLGTLERFTSLDTSFVFTLSRSNDTFQFLPRDLVLSFFSIFPILRLEDGVDSPKYAIMFKSKEKPDL